jgi:hypothetical protein
MTSLVSAVQRLHSLPALGWRTLLSAVIHPLSKSGQLLPYTLLALPSFALTKQSFAER